MTDRDAYVVLHVQPDAHQLVIQAAYRVLAALYHPDRGESLASTRRMAELNDAYNMVRTADRRALYDQERRRRRQSAVMVTPPTASTAQAGGSSGAGQIDFGRYQGWTIANVAKRDPDYLRWLVRHSSGVRFRQEIEAALASAPKGPTASDRVFGRR